RTMTKVIVVAVAGLVVYWIALLVLNGLFGMGIPNLYSSASPLGIGFTAVCLILASLFLVLDFQYIERASEQDAPKYMEWYGAHALLVTVAWIYIEALRLLAKLRSR
ncbi:MAG: Bax inhibitor-1/YccA family protein, partial [Planctomycetota bacterium]